MDHDWEALMWRQSAALADLIEELSDDQLDHDSLCEGWQARDVIGHMVVGHTTPMLSMLGMVAKYKGNIPKGSLEMSRQHARSVSADELRHEWREVANEHIRKGISRTIPYREGFLDHFIHEQDIRRPLGLDAPTDPQRLVPALDAVVRVKGPTFAPAKHVTGLRLEATDLDWSHGEGPVVTGPAEALVMVAGGRRAVLPEVGGEGVSTLTARIA